MLSISQHRSRPRGGCRTPHAPVLPVGGIAFVRRVHGTMTVLRGLAPTSWGHLLHDVRGLGARWVAEGFR